MGATLSITGLYNYDNTIFDDMVIPAELDRENLLDSVLIELSELEILYADSSFMKFAIGSWSKKELKKWQDLYETTVFEYDPIENYNRVDTFADKETRDLKINTTDVDVSSGGDNVNTYATGFDSDEAQLTNKEESTLGAQNNKTINGEDTGTVENERTGSSKGNIGVTTSQQMIGQQRDTVEFNIYDYIVESFKLRFCILVY